MSFFTLSFINSNMRSCFFCENHRWMQYKVAKQSLYKDPLDLLFFIKLLLLFVFLNFPSGVFYFSEGSSKRCLSHYLLGTDTNDSNTRELRGVSLPLPEKLMPTNEKVGKLICSSFPPKSFREVSSQKYFCRLIIITA